MESSAVRIESEGSVISKETPPSSVFSETNASFMHLAMVFVFAGLFGVLANSMQLMAPESLYLSGAYLIAYALVRLAVRSRRLIAGMFSRPMLADILLMILGAGAAVCGYFALLHDEGPSVSSTWLLCTMGLMMGAHASSMFGLWAELASPKGRVMSVKWHVIPLCAGVLAALVIMFLQEQVREWVFVALCPLSSLVWIFSGARAKCARANNALGPRDTFYALANRTHLYWVALMFVFGFAYAIGFRYWTVEYGLGALVACLVIGAAFPFLKTKLGGGLGQTSRLYLPLCILVSFFIASAAPEVFPLAMAIALAFVFYQGLSNITFLMNYARAFNESVIYKLSEGRFPPLAGLSLGVVAGMVLGQYESVVSPLVWMAIPCVACMLAVFMYTLQIFNQGNPVNEGVVRNLDDGIESPWLGDDAQEREAFKLRCQRFAEEKQLTSRETEVFYLLACGYNAVSIAEVLTVSPSTIKTHFYRIYTKVDMHSQQEIIMRMRG